MVISKQYVYFQIYSVLCSDDSNYVSSVFVTEATLALFVICGDI